MDLSEWIGKRVKVELINNFFYEGLVLDAGEDFIKLRDKRDSLVTLFSKSILYISEVSKNGF